MISIHSNCEIRFDNESGNYYPGSNLSGHVKCHFEERIELISVCIQIFGKESTIIPAMRKFHIGENIFFMAKLLCLKPPDYAKTKKQFYEYPTGEHNFYFQIPLPPNLPGSFNSKNAKISYGSIAVIERPTFQINFRTGKWFRVLNYVDLFYVHRKFTEPNCKLLGRIHAGCFGKVHVVIELSANNFPVEFNRELLIALKNSACYTIHKISTAVERRIKIKASQTNRNIVDYVVLCKKDIEEKIQSRETKKIVVRLKVPSYFEIPVFEKLSYLEVNYGLRIDVHFNVFTGAYGKTFPTMVGHLARASEATSKKGKNRARIQKIYKKKNST